MKLVLVATSSIAIVFAFLLTDPEILIHFVSETAASKVAQFGCLFTLAAWIHSGRVKKEIKENFAIFTSAAETHARLVTEAINNVANALNLDLKAQGKRIEKVEKGLDKLSSRVENLEKPKGS